MKDINNLREKSKTDEESYNSDFKSNQLPAHFWTMTSKNDCWIVADSASISKKKWVILNPSMPNELEIQFNQLAEHWKSDTGVFSTISQKVVNDTFLDIIALGKDIVPYILKDLVNGGPAHWHVALKVLTKTNPVLVEDLNKNKKIKEAWIKWGREEGILN